MSSSNIHADLIRWEGHASTCINKTLSSTIYYFESNSLLGFDIVNVPSLATSLARTFYLHLNRVQLGTAVINKLSLSNTPKLTGILSFLRYLKTKTTRTKANTVPRGLSLKKSLGSVHTLKLIYMDLGTNSNYLHIQYQLLVFCNGGVVFTARYKLNISI